MKKDKKQILMTHLKNIERHTMNNTSVALAGDCLQRQLVNLQQYVLSQTGDAYIEEQFSDLCTMMDVTYRALTANVHFTLHHHDKLKELINEAK